MIVRIIGRGKSFSGLATYLTHDPEADTNKRVAWTHTMNCANDHVPSAVDEMVWTSRDAELLKQEAGVRAGGRATENSVKHLSLNWAPDDNPTREHMIETTEDFLRHMKWQEHQAILVAHDDKSYAHVHCMLNVVHPETGLRLNDDFERRRAQEWALQYEREQGRIYCEQRLQSPEQREAGPPRNVWQAFRDNQKEFENRENQLREQRINMEEEAKNQRNSEWGILKEIQRTERTQFFDQGKSEFSSLRLSTYREIRGEFRERWADYYSTARSGSDPEALAVLKAELIANQQAVLEGRRDEACAELREARDARYRALLDDQRNIRADLGLRQEAGLDNGPFLDGLRDRSGGEGLADDFRQAADGTTRAARDDGSNVENARETTSDVEEASDSPWRPPAGHDVGLHLGFSFGSFLDVLFFDLINVGSAPKAPERPRANEFHAAAEAATQKREEHEREEEEAERRRKERALYRE
jgi:hypothetical protein